MKIKDKESFVFVIDLLFFAALMAVGYVLDENDLNEATESLIAIAICFSISGFFLFKIYLGKKIGIINIKIWAIDRAKNRVLFNFAEAFCGIMFILCFLATILVMFKRMF